MKTSAFSKITVEDIQSNPSEMVRKYNAMVSQLTTLLNGGIGDSNFSAVTTEVAVTSGTGVWVPFARKVTGVVLKKVSALQGTLSAPQFWYEDALGGIRVYCTWEGSAARATVKMSLEVE